MNSFPKKYRLVSKRDFQRLIESKSSVADRTLVLYFQSNNCGFPRLGVAVGKKLGTAAYRNKLKRWIRESFRLHRDNVSQTLDLLVMARQTTDIKHFNQVQKSFLHLVEKVKKIT